MGHVVPLCLFYRFLREGKSPSATILLRAGPKGLMKEFNSTPLRLHRIRIGSGVRAADPVHTPWLYPADLMPHGYIQVGSLKGKC